MSAFQCICAIETPVSCKGNYAESCLCTVHQECLLFWERTQPASTIRGATPKGSNCLVCPMHHPQYQVTRWKAFQSEKFNPSPTNNKKTNLLIVWITASIPVKTMTAVSLWNLVIHQVWSIHLQWLRGLILLHLRMQSNYANVTNTSTASRLILNISDSCVSLVEWILVMRLHQLLLVKVLQGHLQVAHLLLEAVPHHPQVALLLLELLCQHQFLSVLPRDTVVLQLNCNLPIHPIIVGVATRRFILHSYVDHWCQTW